MFQATRSGSGLSENAEPAGADEVRLPKILTRGSVGTRSSVLRGSLVLRELESLRFGNENRLSQGNERNWQELMKMDPVTGKASLLKKQSLSQELRMSQEAAEDSASVEELERPVLVTELTRADLFPYEQAIATFVNEMRQSIKQPPLSASVCLNRIISELLTSYLQDAQSEFSQNYLNVVQKSLFNSEPIETVTIQYHSYDRPLFFLEDFEAVLVNAVNVLSESQSDLEKLMFRNYSSVAVGIQVNREGLRILLLLSVSNVTIRSISRPKKEESAIEVCGQFSSLQYGPFLLRVWSSPPQKQSASEDSENVKPLVLVGQQHMSFDINTGDFRVFIQNVPLAEGETRWIELFARQDPNTIKYGIKSSLRVDTKQLDLVSNFWLEWFPEEASSSLFTGRAKQLQFTFPELSDRIAFSHKILLKVTTNPSRESVSTNNDLKTPKALLPSANNIPFPEDHLQVKGTFEHLSEQLSGERTVRRNNPLSQPSKVNSTFESCDHIPLLSFPLARQKFQTTSDPENLRLELESAMDELTLELKKQRNKSRVLQHKICLIFRIKQIRLKDRSDQIQSSDVNTIRYHQLLDSVLSSRALVKELRERYAKETAHNVEQIDGKKAIYSQIKKAFRKFKDQVTKNAVFAVNNRRVSEQMVAMLAAKELSVENSFQSSRLEYLKLRSTINKLERELGKCRSLGELSLIDFEKLRVENQSLADKIEIRSNDIAKTTQRHQQMIHAIAHIKERLHGLRPQADSLQDQYESMSLLIRQKLPFQQAETLPVDDPSGQTKGAP